MAARRKRRVPPVLAAVDLGSNSFHMVVARHAHGQLVIVDRLREMVRLAEGLTPEGGLDAAVQRWADQLQRAEPQALRATRAILRRSGPQGLNDTLDFAAQCFARSLRSGTAAEGLAALGARRPPGWATPS